MPLSLGEAAAVLSEVGRHFYRRGWVLGTSGNFSAVVSEQPMRLAITPSAVHKGQLRPDQFLEIDDQAGVVGAAGLRADALARRPSAETLLHVALVRSRGAGAVLHTHSIWSTILSDHHASAGGLEITGYEMLKGLDGVRTHEHREWIPILENDQDMTRLASMVGKALDAHPEAHAFLLRRHGLYTWGRTIRDAERHVEILEFLLEAMGRSGRLQARA